MAAAQIEQARALHADGKTQREIAEAIGVPQPTINRWLDPFRQSAEMDQDATSQPPDPPAPTEPTPRQQALDAQLKTNLKRLADVKAENAELKARHRHDTLTDPHLRARGRHFLSLR